MIEIAAVDTTKAGEAVRHLALTIRGDVPAAEAVSLARDFFSIDHSDDPQVTIVRPQTSGVCVHADVRADGIPVCTCQLDRCPYLDQDRVWCSLKDLLYSMRYVSKLRQACEKEQEQEVQDFIIVGDTSIAPAPAAEPPRKPFWWTDDEKSVVLAEPSVPAARKAYRQMFPDSQRSDAAIKKYWQANHPSRTGEPVPADPPVEPVAEPPAGKKSKRKSKGRTSWSPEAKAFLAEQPGPGSAAARALLRKFPGDPHTVNQISAMWSLLKRRAPAATESSDQVPSDPVPDSTPSEPPRPVTQEVSPPKNDVWLGRYVKVSGGHHAGQTGTVVRTDSGDGTVLVSFDEGQKSCWIDPVNLHGVS